MVEFGLAKIETTEFAILQENYKENVEFELKTDLAFGIDPSNRIIVVGLKNQFMAEKATFVLLNVNCYFLVGEESWLGFMNKKQDTLKPNTDFLQHLVAVNYSTSRGILHSNLSKSQFNNFVLPLMNVKELVKAPVKFKL